jgi:hypothetical protein
VFAGGDAVTGAATVILAAGAGKRAAAAIHEALAARRSPQSEDERAGAFAGESEEYRP